MVSHEWRSYLLSSRCLRGLKVVEGVLSGYGFVCHKYYLWLNPHTDNESDVNTMEWHVFNVSLLALAPDFFCLWSSFQGLV